MQTELDDFLNSRPHIRRRQTPRLSLLTWCCNHLTFENGRVSLVSVGCGVLIMFHEEGLPVVTIDVIVHGFCFLPCDMCLVFPIPHIGLIILCSISDDVQEEGFGNVLGGEGRPHVRWNVVGKSGKGGNVFEVLGD